MTAWQVPTYPQILALIVASLIILGYAASLWWLLRRESAPVLLGLAALCGVSLSLRLVYTTDFPAGLNEDEPKILRCAYEALMGGDLLIKGCTELPVLLNALFQAQLVPVVGPNRWAIRSYSLVTSVLASAAAFAAARALWFAVVPSFAVAAFIAVLPWSLFYGRVSIGGEMVFHQLLLLAALARLAWAERAGWPEVGIGSLGLSLLLYDYFCGLVMLGMPLVAAVLGRGRRLLCLAVLAIAVATWVPYLRSDPENHETTMVSRVDPQLFSNPRRTIESKARFAFRAFRQPIGEDFALTIRSAAMHPPLILGVAAFGLLTGSGPFLAAGFLGSLVPALVSFGDTVSPHRMLMAYPFIALAAGAALNAIRWRRWCLMATIPIVAIVAAQSVKLYFSPAFWPAKSRATFDWELTSLVEAIPFPTRAHVIYMNQTGYFVGPRLVLDGGANYEQLSVENWLPTNHRATVYAFSQYAAPLRPFYEHLFGPERVQAFGGAFLVKLEAANWGWLRAHGWSYEARCGSSTWRGQVPALFHLYLTFAAANCNGPVTHTWRARWDGPKTTLLLRFNGDADIETSTGQQVHQKAAYGYGMVVVEPGSSVSVTVTRPTLDGAVNTTLFASTPFGERIPPWEWVTPN